jgi:hypothetical protein
VGETIVTTGLKQRAAYSSNLKMEAIYSCETSVAFQRTTQRYIPGDRTPHNYRCENLKSYIMKIAFEFQVVI